MRLIGINGFKTSGKDTVYKILADKYEGVQRAAFADKLKIAAASAIGLGLQKDPEKADNWNEYLIKEMDQLKEAWEFGIKSSLHPLSIPFATFTGRQYLQWFGQGMREVFGDSFWVDQVLPKPRDTFDNFHTEIRTASEEEGFWHGHYPDAQVLCITDVRYPNEAQRIRELGGEIWEVIRPGLESDGHSSEIPLPRELVDLTIPNDDDLDHLAWRVEGAFSFNEAKSLVT